METLTEPQLLTDRLVEVAPLSDKITGISQADDGTWVMEFSGRTLVLMEWAARPSRIVLSAPLGPPPRERAEELFALALSYSALERDSGGARLGLGGDGGELLLIRELHSESAGGWDLLPVLEHFAYVAGWWQDMISRPAAKGASDASPALLRA